MKVEFATLMAMFISATLFAQEIKPHPLNPVPIQQVVIQDEFWSPKIKVWRKVTIPDCFTKFEGDGAINNFIVCKTVKPVNMQGRHSSMGSSTRCPGSADFLAAARDSELEKRIDGYVERIAAAAAGIPMVISIRGPNCGARSALGPQWRERS